MSPFQEELFRLIQDCKKESNAFTTAEEDSGNEVSKIVKFSQKWDFKERHNKLEEEYASLNKKIVNELKNINEKIGRNFFKELVPTIDELFVMTKLMGEGFANPSLERGLSIVLSNLEKLLTRKEGGIIRPKIGEELNPVYHKAIAAEEIINHKGNTISEVYRFGYYAFGLTIREAEVKVKCGVTKK